MALHEVRDASRDQAEALSEVMVLVVGAASRVQAEYLAGQSLLPASAVLLRSGALEVGARAVGGRDEVPLG